jgi:MYXO-CTERM domain-containing protein
VFNAWSNGGNRSQAYLVPTTNQSLTASYVSAGACLPFPQDGLVFHVEADTAVTTAVESSTVTGWGDQSGQGNNLTASGNPQLVANGLNGEDVISFDGSGDILERLSSINGLPAGNADRTVYAVVKYDGTGYGGISFGTNAINEAFGLIVAPSGNLMIQGWGNANDFDSGVAGTSMGWMIQSAVHQAGTLRHYQDGNQIDSRVHSYATDPTRIIVGAEIDRSPFIDMDVAAVMIYDRALSPAERSEIESYFDVKYFGGVKITILAPSEGATVSSGDVTVTYTVAGSDFNHVHLSLDGGEPVMVFESSGSFTFSDVAAGPHTVTAELVDAAHNTITEDGATDTVNFTAADCFPDNFAPNCTVDTDGDGTPDSAETETADSDGDGLPDYTESSILDADSDGTVNQADPDNLDPCIPNNTGAGCTPPRSSGGGSGSFSLAWLLALGGLLALRRRRYTW